MLSLDPADCPTALIGDPGRAAPDPTQPGRQRHQVHRHGEITVSVAVKEATTDSALLLFEVRDTGVGISEEDQSIIFNAFSQADSSDTRRFSGSGLGLSICKDLCQLMGGSISVTSRQGTGSTFRFTARFGQQIDTVQRIDNDPDLPHRFHILLMDPDTASRSALRNQLVRAGIRVEPAGTAAEARVLARQAADRGDNFDVILVDMTQSEAHGLDVVRFMRSEPVYAAVHIVLITAPGQVVPEADQYATQVLTRPVQLASVIELITERAVAGLSVRMLGNPPVDDDPDLHDPNVHHALVVEDNPVNLTVAVGILESLGWKVETAGDGLEALAAHARRRFDVIFMDCQMPKMDGFEATGEIRKREAMGKLRTPIVALTASADKSFRDRCLKAGMDEFVAKPFTRRQIEIGSGDRGVTHHADRRPCCAKRSRRNNRQGVRTGSSPS